MSFQAVTWAIEQRCGSPSAKAVLWSISNYANELWCAFPKQETIANDSEQSIDSVQRRVADLVGGGLARRIKLKRYGRRTHDYIILRPSPLFSAPLEDIRPHLPAGCDVLEDAAADCGSVEEAPAAAPPQESVSSAAADCGSVSGPTLPQSAVHATAMVRQHEYVTNQESLPQTPSHNGEAPKQAREEARGQPREEAAAISGKRERFQHLSETYATRALAPVCSNPEAAFAEWLPLTHEQERQALAGARGVAAIRTRDPKAKGIVGLLRFLRSSALWAEYARFASDAAAPAAHEWVAAGSDEWNARVVIYAIIDRPMPAARSRADGGANGAYFIGALPPAGLALARYAAKPRAEWMLLDVDRDDHKPRIAAWRERVFECIGVRAEPRIVMLEGYTTMKKLDGSTFEARKRVSGLRVPDDWPPRKTVPAHDDDVAPKTDPPKEDDA